jgi:tRNA-binding protein
MHPVQPDVDFEHFAAVDMRVGRVVDVQPFPEARKAAWQITVDFGAELGRRRTSAQVTGYAREDLLGRRVVGAVNLGRKRIAGFTSEFLLLGAVGEDGVVQLLYADDGATPGDRVG